jgi:hypothetical protein
LNPILFFCGEEYKNKQARMSTAKGSMGEWQNYGQRPIK